MDSKKLYEMSQVEIHKIDPKTLVQISTVTIDQKRTHEKKILSYIEQMRNPYCFMSGDIAVRMRFATTDKCLSQSLVNYFSRLKQK